MILLIFTWNHFIVRGFHRRKKLSDLNACFNFSSSFVLSTFRSSFESSHCQFGWFHSKQMMCWNILFFPRRFSKTHFQPRQRVKVFWLFAISTIDCFSLRFENASAIHKHEPTFERVEAHFCSLFVSFPFNQQLLWATTLTSGAANVCWCLAHKKFCRQVETWESQTSRESEPKYILWHAKSASLYFRNHVLVFIRCLRLYALLLHSALLTVRLFPAISRYALKRNSSK